MRDEREAVLPLECGEREPEPLEPLGARALHEPEVVRVIDDAGGIGVFVVDADREGEARRRSGRPGGGHDPGKRSPPAAGAASPKCR